MDDKKQVKRFSVRQQRAIIGEDFRPDIRRDIRPDIRRAGRTGKQGGLEVLGRQPVVSLVPAGCDNLRRQAFAISRS